MIVGSGVCPDSGNDRAADCSDNCEKNDDT